MTIDTITAQMAATIQKETGLPVQVTLISAAPSRFSVCGTPDAVRAADAMLTQGFRCEGIEEYEGEAYGWYQAA